MLLPNRSHTPPRSTHSPVQSGNSSGRNSAGRRSPALVELVTPQRLADLTGALESFLQVMDKCDRISESADRAVSNLDESMSKLDRGNSNSALLQRSGRKESTFGASDVRSPQSFTPFASTGRLLQSKGSAASMRKVDSFYDASYVEEYSDGEGSGQRSLRYSGSFRADPTATPAADRALHRSCSGSQSNVFGSASSIKREHLPTTHFLSPSSKPALPKFTRSDSKHDAAPAVRPNGNITASNNYFKQHDRHTSQGSVSGQSQRSKAPEKPAAASPVPPGRPAVKPALPVFKTKSARKDRAYSFASTIATVTSSDGNDPLTARSRLSGDIPPAASLDEQSHRSGRSGRSTTRVVIDGKVREVPSRSPGRARSDSAGSSPSAPNSRSRSASRDRAQTSPKEIQSKHMNPTTYSFRQEKSPRKVF
jgi:hypothetical protein